MKFLHISSDSLVTKESFKPPSIHKQGCTEMHSFNLFGGLYLSKVDDDNESMWLKHRVDIMTSSGEPDLWVVGRKQYFDIDLIKDKIYLVDTHNDLITFFSRYGCFNQYIDRLGNLRTEITAIDYPLLVEHGYNGVYYSDSLIKNREDIPTIPFPDILGDSCSDDLYSIHNSILYYLKWLGSDTMILWKWIFD